MANLRKQRACDVNDVLIVYLSKRDCYERQKKEVLATMQKEDGKGYNPIYSLYNFR